MASYPVANCMGLDRTLICGVESSDRWSSRELEPVGDITCDSSRANTLEANLGGPKRPGRYRSWGYDVIYAPVWLSNAPRKPKSRERLTKGDIHGTNGKGPLHGCLARRMQP